MKKKSSNIYMLYAFISVFFWSTAFLFTQYAQESFTSRSIGFLRYAAASLALVLVLAVKKAGLPKLKDVPKFLISGFLGFACYVTLFNTAAETITGAAGSVIGQCVPILTAVFSCILFKEKISLKGWLSIALAFCGILVIALWNGAFSVNPGVFWMLAAATSLSIYNVSQRWLVKGDYTPLQTTAYSMFGGTIFLFFFLPETLPQIAAATPRAWISILILGIFASAIAYVTWTKAFALAERTSDVSNFMFLIPIITSIFGFFGRGEVPGIETYIGAVLLIGGMILFQMAKKRP